MNPTPTFLDHLRVEIREPAPAGSHINLIENPGGDTGTYGWGTRGVGYVLSQLRDDVDLIERVIYNGARALRWTSTAASVNGSWRQGFTLSSHMFRVTAGQKFRFGLTPAIVEYRANAAASWSTSGKWNMSVYFYDVAGTFLSSVPVASNLNDPSTSRVSKVATVPAGAAQAVLVIGVFTSPSGFTFQQRVTFTDVFALCEDTDPGATPTFSVPTWRNVITSASSIDVDREALGVGEVKVVIPDSTLDPVVNDLIRPGTPARLTCLTPSNAWEPLMTGNLGDPTVDYNQQQLALSDPARSRKGAVITLTFNDPLTMLANLPAPFAYRSRGIPLLLDGVTVPWDINGRADRSLTASADGYNENASVADQLVIARDTETARGTTTWVWVTRGGVVKARSADLAPGTVTTLTTSDYTAAPASYALDRLINQVRVQVQSRVSMFSTDPAQGGWSFTGEDTEFGPYRNAGSVQIYGARDTQLTIAASVDIAAVASAAATKMLAANGVPARHIDSVTLPIRSNADLVATRALLDLYDQVTVVTPALTQTARITGISHRITPKGWLMTILFDVPGSVPAPLSTPSATSSSPGAARSAAVLASGWSNFGGDFEVASFARDNDRVYLAGEVKGGSGTIFTLPDGFRPRADEVFDTVGGGNAIARVDVIAASGDVRFVAGSASAVSLSGIDFWAAD